MNLNAMTMQRLLYLIIFISFYGTVAAQDSLQVSQTDSIVKKKGIIKSIISYFEESNKQKLNKKFDFSIIGGPHYSSDTKVGLGLVAAGLYRTNLADTITPPSNVSLYGDLSSVGFYLIGIRGYHIFPEDRYRLNYKLYFYSFSSKFWGIGYDNAIKESNETKYKRLQAKVEASFMFRLTDNLFAGPSGQFSFINGKNVTDLSLWDGQSMRTKNYGVGATVYYDSRDNINNAFKGYFFSLEQKFYPRFLWNHYAFSSTELTASGYHRVWKGGVIATQIHGMLTYGNTPWGMLATLGGSNTMRGYYDGQYRDKCEIDATVELRQHVYHRNGIVVWAGAGTIFPKFSAVRWREILPNFGIGYRWEFKNRINVRLDYGFGRHTSGLVFNINEAF